MSDEIQPMQIFQTPRVRPVAKDEQRQKDDRFRKGLAELIEGEEGEEAQEQDKRTQAHLPGSDGEIDREPGDEPPGVGQNLDVRT